LLFQTLSMPFFAENIFMGGNFWDNIKGLLSDRNKPDIWLIREARLGKTAIINGQRRDTVPSADKACRIARVLETTVEELVHGEEGGEYVRRLFAEKGLIWEPPSHLADIVGALGALDDDTLETVRTMVLSLAGGSDKRQKLPPLVARPTAPAYTKGIVTKQDEVS